jgi:hypothetical protein
MFSASRKSVTIRSSEGNTEKLTGCRMYIETSRIRIESVMLRLIRRSIASVGMGSTMTSRMHTTATGTTRWTLPTA